MKYKPDEYYAYEYEARYPDRIALKGSGAGPAADSESGDINASAGGSKPCMPDYRGRDSRDSSRMRRC